MKTISLLQPQSNIFPILDDPNGLIEFAVVFYDLIAPNPQENPIDELDIVNTLIDWAVEIEDEFFDVSVIASLISSSGEMVNFANNNQVSSLETGHTFEVFINLYCDTYLKAMGIIQHSPMQQFYSKVSLREMRTIRS